MPQVPAGYASTLVSAPEKSVRASDPILCARSFSSDLGAAAALVLGTLALRLLLERWLGDKFVFMPFLPVIVLGAWYRGRRCGFMVTALATAAIACVWLPHSLSFRLSDLDDVFRTLSFIAIGLLLTHLLGRGRDTMAAWQATAAREIEVQHELRATNARLEKQILELQRTEAALREAKDELSQLNAGLEQRVQERIAAQAALTAEMESFAYTVSHDLRAPLRAISGFAEALREDHGGSLADDAQDMIDRIIRGTDRMDRLINALLAYSRVNRHEIRLSPVALGDCLRQVIADAPELQAPRARVEVTESLPTVLAADTLLMQVLANLLGNAVKFVPPGRTPEVRITAEAIDGGVRLWVIDNGIGIRPEFQPRLFRLFERLNAGQTYEGSGMGLAIVRRALSRMDGTVGVESDGQTGSRFWVQLKLAEPVTPTPTSAPMLAAVD